MKSSDTSPIFLCSFTLLIFLGLLIYSMVIEPGSCFAQTIGNAKKISHSADPGFTNEMGMKFVLVPAGTFMMGSPLNEKGRNSDEMQHRVTITRSFYLQTTEVTQGQWQAIMVNNPSHFSGCGENCPVEKVSWHDIQRFIKRLNEREGKGRYRLPTEAEWEYAARAGSTTPFPNGEITVTGCGFDANMDQIGWYCGNSDYKSHQVAKKQPNKWGLYDMHGNVWEWCYDWYGDYPKGHVTDPKGPINGFIRVNRGGSLNDFSMFGRSANRIRYMPFDRTNDLGFRVAATP